MPNNNLAESEGKFIVFDSVLVLDQNLNSVIRHLGEALAHWTLSNILSLMVSLYLQRSIIRTSQSYHNNKPPHCIYYKVDRRKTSKAVGLITIVLCVS